VGCWNRPANDQIGSPSKEGDDTGDEEVEDPEDEVDDIKEDVEDSAREGVGKSDELFA
jgi:hypothetical protein